MWVGGGLPCEARQVTDDALHPSRLGWRSIRQEAATAKATRRIRKALDSSDFCRYHERRPSSNHHLGVEATPAARPKAKMRPDSVRDN